MHCCTSTLVNLSVLLALSEIAPGAHMAARHHTVVAADLRTIANFVLTLACFVHSVANLFLMLNIL